MRRLRCAGADGFGGASPVKVELDPASCAVRSQVDVAEPGEQGEVRERSRAMYSIRPPFARRESGAKSRRAPACRSAISSAGESSGLRAPERGIKGRPAGLPPRSTFAHHLL